MSGTLYVVATPIGNMRDITLRAIDILKTVDLIACEDTRHTQLLLDKYSIGTSTVSYHKFNLKQRTNYLIDQMLSGKNVALVSDAGTPGISDPGEELIKAAVNSGIKIEIVPGASAAISALSISGMDTSGFTFKGFLPSKRAERLKMIKELLKERDTIVLYEAPHRLIETLNDMKDVLGDRKISISRELTKKFEETVRGKISEMIERFGRTAPKGEFVIVVSGAGGRKIKEDSGEDRLVKQLIKAGLSRNIASKIVAKHFGASKNALYRGSLDV